jgi:hypothetical protein
MAWAKIPTRWIIQDSKLSQLTWDKHGSDATAALILLISLAIMFNRSNIGKGGKREYPARGFHASYEKLRDFTGLSRAKIAAGLSLLRWLQVIDVEQYGRRNWYSLTGVLKAGQWGQLPQTHLLRTASFAFRKFQLRHPNEMNALKLYLVLLAYRNVRGNFTAIGYEKICQVTGMEWKDVGLALELLRDFDLVHIEEGEPRESQLGRPYNRYRVRGLGNEPVEQSTHAAVDRTCAPTAWG